MSAQSPLEVLQFRIAELEARLDQQGQAQRLSEARLSSLLSLSADWIWEQDEELRFTYFSAGLEQALGIPRATLLGRRRLADDRFDTADEELMRYRSAIEQRQPFRDFRYRARTPEGELRHIRISGEPVFDERGTFKGYRGIGQDVTVAALATQQAHRLASTDSLTGLPNRSTFLSELDHALARARRNGEPCAVCFIDLDRFKAINDTLGHAAGDELLKVMAQRLRAALRASDTVARLGGDEFVVLLEGGDEHTDYGHAGAKMLAAIREPLVLHQRSFHVTGSIGISLFPRHGRDAAALLQCADSAMYHAKDGGKNQVRIYSADLADQSARRFALESELRHALVRSEFVLHYQPRIHIASGRMVSVEALVRWLHPSRGLVSPGEFIPVAEDSGLIVALGRWVIQQACRQLADWRAQGLQAVPVAVNLSARQFASETLVDDLKDSMAFFGIEPGMVEVELTESALMAEPERANEVLQRFNGMGVKIAIDDFGTGYSSLSYLKRFPAQMVKIDRSFIAGLPGDSDDTVITQAVIAMAHSLGLAVAAEGVERPEQLELLERMGCDEAQGFLLARPMPASALAERLQQSTN